MDISEAECGSHGTAPRRDARSLIPLTPAVFHLMLALASGERHGYALVQEVERMTGGQVRIGPGTLYRSLQRMLVEGLLVELKDGSSPDDSRRRYYRLTEFGVIVAREEARRFEALVAAAVARGLLPGPDPVPSVGPGPAASGAAP
jgi:DNA-binding MarR family transcriptional regulator